MFPFFLNYFPRFSNDTSKFFSHPILMLLFSAAEENDAPDILSLRLHVSVFIGIQKRTLNFSLWKCIVCWIVASVPCGVENNTPSQHTPSHWEKYYCQIFWDDFLGRSPFFLPQCEVTVLFIYFIYIYIVLNVGNIVYLQNKCHNGTCCHMLQAHVRSCVWAKSVQRVQTDGKK